MDPSPSPSPSQQQYPQDPPVPHLQFPPVLPYLDPSACLTRPHRPRVWTVFVAFIVALLLGAIVPALVMIPLVAVRFGGESLKSAGQEETLAKWLADPVVFLPSIGSTQVVLVAVAVGGAVLSPVPWRKRLRLGRPRLPWYGLAVVLLGTVALGTALSLLVQLLGWGNEGALKMFQDALGGLRGTSLVAAALVIGLAPGFGEELLFRGYTQTRLTHRWGAWVSILVTSALFAVIHFDLVQGMAVLLIGLYLGIVTERAGSIWPAIACHALNNMGSTLVAPLEAGGGPLVPDARALGIIAVSLGVLAACLWYVLRRPPVPVDEPVMAPAMMPFELAPARMGYGAPGGGNV